MSIDADPITGEVVPVRRRELDVLREQIAPEANDDELRWLAAVSQRLALDPIAGHIVLIGRYDSRIKRVVYRPQITADGRLVLADRTGELDGFTGPEWTGPRNDDGSHTWLDVWDRDEPPHAARVFVYRRGRTHPANGTVRWREFAQTKTDGDLMPTWKQMPSHMLGKVALSLGLRRAFPGISTPDLDDDFVPLEAEAPTAEGGPTDEIDRVTTSPDSIAVLSASLNSLSPAQRQQFLRWCDEQGWTFPTGDTATLDAMAAKVDVMLDKEAHGE